MLKSRKRVFIVETKKPIGTFKAITFSGETIDFIVKSDGIHCDLLSERLLEKYRSMPIRMLHIKPNFAYYYYDDWSRIVPHCLKESGMHNSLIKNFQIDQDLLITMNKLQLVRYSKEMAILYGLDERLSFDGGTQRRAFKHVALEKRMLLQKKGIFN